MAVSARLQEPKVDAGSGVSSNITTSSRTRTEAPPQLTISNSDAVRTTCMRWDGLSGRSAFVRREVSTSRQLGPDLVEERE